MTKFYRVDTPNFFNSKVKKGSMYKGGLSINVTKDKLSVTSDGKTFDYTIDYFLNKKVDNQVRKENTPFARWIFAFNTYIQTNDDGTSTKYAYFNNYVFNLYERNKRTKQVAKDQALTIGYHCPLNLFIFPDTKDFSNVVLSLSTREENIVDVTGADVEKISLPEFNIIKREMAPKFIIDGSNTIKSGTKETYIISYEKDTNANFRVKFGNNIGIINKSDTYLINGKTKVTVDASDLDIGEEIQLEVGTYEFTNTSRIKIKVI